MAAHKLTSEEWIQKAQNVHGSQYDYSKTVYIGSEYPITITCPKHGEFIVPNAYSHIRKTKYTGCPLCTKEKEERERNLHFKYLKTLIKEVSNGKWSIKEDQIYTNNKSRLICVCKEHGEWRSNGASIISGRGCPKCAIEAVSIKNTIGDKENRELILFFNNHNIELVDGHNYTNKKIKHPFICKEHGIFKSSIESIISSLKNGNNGCKKCRDDASVIRETFSFDVILEKMKDVHNSKYEYIEASYKNTKTKMEIICPVHGTFYQTPEIHMKGSGCSKCKSSKLEKAIIKYCQENNIEFIHQYKSEWLGSLTLDFYFPKFNIGLECQGLQHFIPIEYFGGVNGFTKTQERDQLKFNLCKEKGTLLLYFSNIKGYKEFLNESLYKDINELFSVIIK